MLRDFVSTAGHLHAEYRRRRFRSPEPLEQRRLGLRRAIGHSLIALGERLALPETRRPLDKAA
jgi:hypothetical protein